MGALFLAHDPAIDRMLAIKVLREGLDDEELRTRFAREARAAGRLRHPNIVTIFDVGEHEGQPYIAMEYVPGETLGSLIQRQTRLPLSRKLRLLEELCDGLAYAHRNGLVHRDIKPANLMVDAEGMLKILDFGIVRVAESGMTQKDALVGTVPYMSPEQVGSGRPVDHRSDIFAVGDVAYELLSSRQAFPGSITDGVFDRIKSKEPPPLAELCPDVPVDLVRIVARAMAKDPDQRYQDLAAMRNELAKVRERVQRDEERPTEIVEGEGPTMPGARGARQARKPPSTSRPPERDSMAKRRATLVAQHLDKAKLALEARDFEQAIAAAEEAALLDPGCEPAHQIIDEANRCIQDRHVQQFLAQARDHLNRGDPTLAAVLVDQALSVKPDSPEALSVSKTIEEVRRELEMAREQAQVVLEAVARARAHLDEGAFELAIRAADEALARQAGHPEAVEIRERAVALLEERRKKEAADRAAEQAIDTARGEFQAKRYDAALAGLEQFAPPHERVTAALDDLRRQVSAIRVAETEARNQKVAALAAAAQQAADAGKYDQALGMLGRIRELDSQSEIAASLTKEVMRRKAEAEETARNREKAKAAARTATDAFEKHDLTAALTAVEEALRLDPQNSGALSLRDAVQQQRGLLTSHVEAARQALAAQRVQDARQELERARAIDPNDRSLKDVQAQTATLEEAIDARTRQREQQARAIEERRQREQLEAEERRQCEQREAEERRVRQEREAEEQRVRQEREAAERRDAETHARNEKISKGIEKAWKKASPDAALALLRPLLELDADHPELNACIREHEAALERRLTEPAPPASRGWSPAYLAVAALAVAALAAGIWMAIPSSPEPALEQEAGGTVAGGTAPPSATTPTAGSPPPLQPPSAAPPVTPPASEPVAPPTPDAAKTTPSPTETTARLEAELAPIRQRARQQFESGQADQALATAQRGLKLKADDAQIRGLLDAMLRRASTDTAGARNDAVAADASANASAPFEHASQQLRAAESDQRAGRIESALRNFWAARDSFREATTGARSAAEERQRREVALKEELRRKQELEARAAPSAGGNVGGAAAGRSGPATATQAPESAPAPPDPANAIRQTLRAYESAFSSMNLAGLQQVQALTQAQVRQLRISFDQAREYVVQVQVQNIAVAPDGRRATVNAQVRRAFTARSGGGKNDVVVPTVFVMEQRGDGWIITDVKATR